MKNKIAPPFKEAEFDIMFGQGISREGDVLDLAVRENIIIKSGSWFAYQDAKIGQGRENAKQYLKDNPDIFEEVEQKVREKLAMLPGAGEGEEPKEEEGKPSKEPKAQKDAKDSKEKEAKQDQEAEAVPEAAEEEKVEAASEEAAFTEEE